MHITWPMSSRSSMFGWTCLVALSLAEAPASASAAPVYQVLDLAKFASESVGDTAAYGINDLGQVVGQLYSRRLVQQGFRTQPSAAINLSTDRLGTYELTSNTSIVTAINSSGQATGANEMFLPNRWDPNAPPDTTGTSLAPPGFPEDTGGAGTAINNRGQVGIWLSSGLAYRTQPNAALNLATDYVGDGFVSGLNDLGQAVGFIRGTSDRAFRTAPDMPFDPLSDDLGTLGGENSAARAINSHGQVVGWATTDFSTDELNYPLLLGHPHAFLSTPNGAPTTLLTDLGTLGGTSSWAQAINERGDVVGYSTLAGDLQQHAFLYSNGLMLDLNDLVDSSVGDFVITSAAGINNRGQIAATGFLRIAGIPPEFQPEHALLLTPIPEPSTIALSVLGLLCLAWHCRRRGVLALACSTVKPSFGFAVGRRRAR